MFGKKTSKAKLRWQTAVAHPMFQEKVTITTTTTIITTTITITTITTTTTILIIIINIVQVLELMKQSRPNKGFNPAILEL